MLEELGIGFVPFSPLGASFLTGQIDENTKFDPTGFRKHVPRFLLGARKAKMVLVYALQAAAGRKGAAPAPIALGWLLAVAQTQEGKTVWLESVSEQVKKGTEI